MALPNSFSNNTNPTGPQLDANFAAVGALTVIPCTASGTNTLVLAPNASTPTTNAYANYGRFSGVAAATNTGAVTARIGSLAALNVYRDTPAGPVVLTGGEIVIGCAFTLVYDSTLNTGAGGFHLVSQANAFPWTGGTITNGAVSVVGGSLNGSTFVPLGTITNNGMTLSAPTLVGTIGSLSKLLVGASAASVTRILSTLATVAYSLIAAQTAQDQNATLAGVQLGDSISLGYTVGQTNTVLSPFVPAAGTVTLRALNAGAGTVGAFTLTARVTAHGFT